MRCFFFLIFNLFDGLFTAYALTNPYVHEYNPLMEFIHSKTGPIGLITAKIIIPIAILVLVYKFFSVRQANRIITVATTILFVVVVYMGLLAYFIWEINAYQTHF